MKFHFAFVIILVYELGVHRLIILFFLFVAQK